MHDLIDPRIDSALDRLMDQWVHHTQIPPADVSLRRLCSYVNRLPDLLETDANVYGWPRE